jgi:hypothetical protein
MSQLCSIVVNLTQCHCPATRYACSFTRSRLPTALRPLSTRAAAGSPSMDPFPIHPSPWARPPVTDFRPPCRRRRRVLSARAARPPFTVSGRSVPRGDRGKSRQGYSQLELLNLEESDESETYDGDPPTCVHYSIEWKTTPNNKLIFKDTEPDLVLAPRFYWPLSFLVNHRLMVPGTPLRPWTSLLA